MARRKKSRMMEWGVSPDDIRDSEMAKKFHTMEREAKATMDLRTRGHAFFSKVSHMQNLFDHNEKTFSEGSTQSIKRKIRSETIQRVPDGEIKTQFDKNSIEQAEIDYIFKNKILRSEYDGRDMLKNLWRTFDASYDYGYACVRTGFEKDNDGDFRTTYKLIQWNDILPAPDCDFIEEADWYLVREYMSRSDLFALLDEDGNVKDGTYNEDVVHYLLENDLNDAQDPRSIPLADRKNHVAKTESVEILTKYCRGKKTFTTFVPCCDAVLRIVDNYDPRLDVPLHFCILEPDPDFPLGCSSIMWTLSQQQFADAFQTTAYQTLLLAANPPLLSYGNLTSAKLRMKPRSIWNMGTNPNNKIEKFPVETTTITQYGSILNNVSANMMKNLNVTESNVATDSQTMGYSATPQGVELQRREKSTTVNQYQKRMEVFFSEWANHAIRSYLNAMGGKQELTVDEDTRRKIWSIESTQSEKDELGIPVVDSIINGDKIEIDFDILKDTMLEFNVRTGSLIQGEKEEEMQHIQELIVPVSQMMGNISDENRSAFEQVLMGLVSRLAELSDIDIAAESAAPIQDNNVLMALKHTMEMVMQQQQQIDQMGQIMSQMGQQQQNDTQGQMQQGQQMPPNEQLMQNIQPELQQGIQDQDEITPEMIQQILSQNQGSTEGMPQDIPTDTEGMPQEEMPQQI